MNFNCSKFNQRVDNLPSTITHLIFSYSFNQLVVTQEVLSKDNTYGAHHKFTFSKFIRCNLPCSITDLTFSSDLFLIIH